MCELGRLPHDAACGAWICEAQLTTLLGGRARHEFLEDIFLLISLELDPHK